MADRSATTKNENPYDYSYLKILSYKNLIKKENVDAS